MQTSALDDQQLQQHTAEYALRLGDDALIVGQRLCEWCADAPMLEEDLAISNVGLDYFGRARMLLQYAGSGLDKSEDELAFLRDVADFRNLLITEMPRGDFAYTIVKHYLLDEFENLFFAQLMSSSDETLCGVASKSIKEVNYHLRRHSQWMRRLGLGTEESNQRAQAAIDDLWGYTPEFFIMDDVETNLYRAGVAVDREALQPAWQDRVLSLLAQVNLRVPEQEWQVSGGRQGVHTEHLGHLLAQMQFLPRAYPGAKW